MSFNPKLHNRRSIRLKGYDYSQAGLYFVTICVQNRKCLFGNMVNQEMILNESGQMIEKWYYQLPTKFDDIQRHEMIVMPNHFHCIIENVGPVAADPSACPNNNPHIQPHNDKNTTEHREGEHIGSPLHRVVQWFKTMTTNEYIRGVKNLGWQPFPGKLWQRNYYKHIIRTPRAYENISNYIINNPAKWQADKFHLI